MDPALCRDTLAALLAHEVAALDELAGMLEREHPIIVANDVDTLDKALEERQKVIVRIAQIESERGGLCRAHGKSADRTGLGQLIAWCDPRGTLRAPLTAFSKSALRCRQLNDKNGALVIARLKRVEKMLGTLTGRPPETPTYGPKGLYDAPRSQRLLAIKA